LSPFGTVAHDWQTPLMTYARRVVLIVSLVATTGLALVLGVTDPAPPLTYPTRFFVWNLGLACIPVFFAAGFAVVSRRIWLIPLGLGWLAFLPNAPYLVTDLVHLGSDAELWRHVMQYGVAAWTGLILGVASMHLIHQRIERVRCGDGMDRGSRLGRPVRDRCGDRAVPAVELLGFADATRRGGSYDARLGAFAARPRPVDRCGARGRGLLRAGVPDAVVPLALPSAGTRVVPANEMSPRRTTDPRRRPGDFRQPLDEINRTDGVQSRHRGGAPSYRGRRGVLGVFHWSTVCP
jgi:hypothetical protein